jgi:hypothetical protein
MKTGVKKTAEGDRGLCFASPSFLRDRACDASERQKVSQELSDNSRSIPPIDARAADEFNDRSHLNGGAKNEHEHELPA